MTRRIRHNGIVQPLKAWAAYLGIGEATLRARLKKHPKALAFAAGPYERAPFDEAAIDARTAARLARDRLALGPLGRTRPASAGERSAVDLALDALEARAEFVRRYARYTQAVEVVQRWWIRRLEMAS